LVYVHYAVGVGQRNLNSCPTWLLGEGVHTPLT
jgi:hypothetical protein